MVLVIFCYIAAILLRVSSCRSTASSSDIGADKIRAIFSANVLQCFYNSFTGIFDFELLWQSGNSIETLSSVYKDIPVPNSWDISLINTFNKTDEVVDNCYDDNQWWLFGWISAYEMTGRMEYLHRAAAAFDYVAINAWTDHCGGGVMWCPQSNPMNEYKNAITNELFLTAAMRLHQYEGVLQKAPSYYLNWATREWDWFSTSGLINSDNLINDGLDSSTCQSNKQTTWTYNQGVLLDGLALLSKAVGNASMMTAAEQIADAAMTKLTSPEGVLVEPCSSGGGCNHDQQIFKGVFARHLAAFLPLMQDAAVVARARSFLATNADSMLATDSCSNGGYGLSWSGPESALNSVAEQSAATDLLAAAASSGTWMPATEEGRGIGFGGCVDDNGTAMPQCYTLSVSEQHCRDAVVAMDAAGKG